MLHVGPDVEFQKAAHPRQAREETRGDVVHTKRDDAEPSLPVKRVEFQVRLEEGLERGGRHGPVGE